DLSLVIDYLQDQGFILDEVIYQLKKEEEIIAVEVGRLQKFPRDLFWRLQVLPELESLQTELGLRITQGHLQGRGWLELKHQLNGLNFLNHILGINDPSLMQADLYLNS